MRTGNARNSDAIVVLVIRYRYLSCNDRHMKEIQWNFCLKRETCGSQGCFVGNLDLTILLKNESSGFAKR